MDQLLRQMRFSNETLRAQLINKVLIYAAKYGEIDFTVPKFDEFLIRKRG